MSHKKITLKRLIERSIPLELEVAIHPVSNGIIILNYPGIGADADGYNNKYGKIADFLQEKNIGTVIRIGNRDFDEDDDFFGLPYPETMIDNFKHLIDYSLDNAEDLCGNINPKLYLMGFSAGAGVVASLANYHPSIEKLLLIAPAEDAGREVIKKGLEKFTGEVYITVGMGDTVVFPEAGKRFYDWAKNAKVRKVEYVPYCDHQFKGENNGRILSKAPLWAFARDTTFPSPENGKILYD